MPNPTTAHHPSAEPVTLIAPGTTLKGELAFTTSARILGQVEGRITTAGRLEVGPGAVCRAAIDAGTLLIEGTVEGNVTARERIELLPDAVVTGDLCAPRLIVAEGATITGQCTVGVPAAKRAPEPAPTPTWELKPMPGPVRPPAVVTKPTSGSDLDGAIAGLESKLAGLANARVLAGATSGSLTHS